MAEESTPTLSSITLSPEDYQVQVPIFRISHDLNLDSLTSGVCSLQNQAESWSRQIILRQSYALLQSYLATRTLETSIERDMIFMTLQLQGSMGLRLPMNSGAEPKT